MHYIDTSDAANEKQRYAIEKFLDYSSGDFVTLDSIFLEDLRQLSAQSYVLSTEARPDYIAYLIYGDTQFTHVLMLYNNLIDFVNGNFSAGTIIKYPALADLENLLFSLKTRARANALLNQ